MRRADRLFQLVLILRGRRLVTARQLARELEVSERTVYRDVADLSASGVPIEGEAGVGYRLRDFDLPPMMFGREEIEALVLGARVVESWTDPALAEAARSVLAKVEAVLPRDKRGYVRSTRLHAPADHLRAELEVDFGELRRAIREERRIRFTYVDADGKRSRRTVRPLSMAFYGAVWVVAAWCELRRDFRAFRPDRMAELEVLQPFPAEEGKTLDDFLARIAADDA